MKIDIDLDDFVKAPNIAFNRGVSELASILSIEFPKPVVDSFLNHHEGAYLSYAIALFVIRKS